MPARQVVNQTVMAKFAFKHPVKRSLSLRRKIILGFDFNNKVHHAVSGVGCLALIQALPTRTGLTILLGGLEDVDIVVHQSCVYVNQSKARPGTLVDHNLPGDCMAAVIFKFGGIIYDHSQATSGLQARP